MSWGTLTLGALTLKETYALSDSVNESTGRRKVTLSGKETTGWATRLRLREVAEDLISLRGRYLPATFTNKTDRNGYYHVEDVNTSVLDWGTEGASLDWSLDLAYMGPDNAVEVESRMSHVVRSNPDGLSGERWHAPPIGHTGYYVGAVLPASVARSGADGPITVYRAIPAVNPRYGVPLANYRGGRARLLTTTTGAERIGTGIRMDPTGWELNNGLVRVKPNTDNGTFTTLLVAVWVEGAWKERAWDIRIAGDSIRPGADLNGVTIVRNSLEQVTLRCVGTHATAGRFMFDLVLRRGSRFVEGYVQRATSGQISVQLDVAEPFTLTGQYTVANGEDSAGLRWAAGTAKSGYSLATNGGISHNSTAAIDFWIGAEVPKPSVGGSNPGFETGNISPWFAINGAPTLRSGDAKLGTYYGRVTATAAGTEVRLVHSESATPGVAGKSYTISGWLRSPVAVTAGEAFVQLSWYNGATLLSGSVINAPALPANTWTAVSGTAVAPASTTLIARSGGIKGTTVVAGTILDVDSLQVRETIDSGDAVATLHNQYLAVAGETMVVVPR